MTVYVDDMYRVPMGQFGRMKMSHMIAESFDELHAMADRLGLKRSWFQGDHYDISMSVRARAVALGAVEIPMRQLAALSVLQRLKEPMGAPETAVDRLMAIREARRSQNGHT
ncbi:MAG: DUF4031 domain-containing protein [Acidobacteria bacterium]|nr:DUF4031 domain-containing protein [Acidobacteriota bacterium]